MTPPPPSRLPSAFVSVSSCPICAYSLKDLAVDAPCPECGQAIDHVLLASQDLHNKITETRTWCVLGIMGWCIAAFVFWSYNMIVISIMNSYYPGTYGLIDKAGVWLQTSFVFAPIVLCYSWRRNAKRMIYRAATKHAENKVKTPKRVLLVISPGVLFGLAGCLGILAMLSAL